MIVFCLYIAQCSSMDVYIAGHIRESETEVQLNLQAEALLAAMDYTLPRTQMIVNQ